MAKILIVEDEIPINKLIFKNLSIVGHECTSVYDGDTAISLINNTSPDLIILDVMLPGMSGFEVIKFVNDTPVIFVTAKSGLEDKLNGLSLGADDYIVKPFEMQELLARVQMVLRRFKRDRSDIFFDGLRVDFEGRKVYRGEKEIDLTPKEFSLLEVLIKNRNIAMSREKLLNLVWQYDYEGEARTVDVHIQKLRSKLDLKDRIKTMSKVGYRFEL